MFTGMRSENPADSEVQDAAALRQQRRLKQAIQFLHRDSADLLPLDGLKKLGTSKQGQPHHILQKRLLEAKFSRGRTNMCRVTPNNRDLLLNCHHFNLHEDEEEEEEDFIHVPCKCLGQETNLLIDTGCRLNLISSLTVERFGLKDLVEENKMEIDGSPFRPKLCVDGYIKELSLTVGELRVICSFAIIDSNRPLMSLGSKTLKSLKSVIDTERQMLVFGTNVREQVQFVKKMFTDSREMASEASLIPLFLGKQRCNITFIVDSSENRSAVLGSVKRLLIQTLLAKALLRDSLFNIMAFSGRLTCWSDHMCPCAPDTVYMSLSWIHSISYSPGRDLLAALSVAFTDPACHAVHLICTDLPDHPEAVLAALPALAAGRPLHIFYLQDSERQLDGNARHYLQCQAQATRGSCYVIPLGLNGTLEKAVPLCLPEDRSSFPLQTASSTKCCFPSSPALISHHMPSPLLSLGNPLRPVTSYKIPSQSLNPEFSPGDRVLARKEVDGLYYTCTVIQQVQSCGAVWLVEFDHPVPASSAAVSSQRQLVCSPDMVNHTRSHVSSLVPGDTVLSPWEPDLRRFGPGRVMAATDAGGVDGDVSVRVLMWNRCTSLVPGSLVLPISVSRHERIVRELHISTSTSGRCCSCPCARSYSCPPQLFCSSWSPPSSQCSSVTKHRPRLVPPSFRSSCGGTDGFEREEQDMDVKKTDSEVTSSSLSSSESETKAKFPPAVKLKSEGQRLPWRYWRRTGQEPQHKKPGSVVPQRRTQPVSFSFPVPQTSASPNHSSLFQSLPGAKGRRHNIQEVFGTTTFKPRPPAGLRPFSGNKAVTVHV
ncbi:uncharacterized protein V6R79_011290 [Siganus canaliculatus]